MHGNSLQVVPVHGADACGGRILVHDLIETPRQLRDGSSAAKQGKGRILCLDIRLCHGAD